MKLTLSSGQITVPVERDGAEVGSICFNPGDLGFVERFNALVGGLDQLERDYSGRMAELEVDTRETALGVPENMQKRLELLREVCGTMKTKVDEVFGSGTSQTVFGEANTVEMFAQFFEELTPIIRQSRQEKIEKYLPGKKAGVLR